MPRRIASHNKRRNQSGKEVGKIQGDSMGRNDSDEQKTISIQKSSKTHKEKNNDMSIQVDQQRIGEGMKDLVKQKIRKYKILLENYIGWVLKNIINVEPDRRCQDHHKQDNQDSIKLCQDCMEARKSEKWYKQLKIMESYKHLATQYTQLAQSLKNNELNLKILPKLLKQLNLWLKLLAGPYFSWRIKENFIEIQRFIIKCLEKIVKYKDLGPQFGQIVQKTKQENKKNWDNQKICRITRSGKGQKRPVEYEEILLNSNKPKRGRGKKNQKVIADDIKQEFQNFLEMLQRDQMYSNFKVIIVRDTSELGGCFKVLDKKQYMRKRKHKQKDSKVKLEEKFICQTEDQQQQYTPDQQLEWQAERIIKKAKLNKIQLEYQEEEQNRLRQEKQIKSDLQFLQRYKMRSNVLVIEKYHQKSQLNWDKKWEAVFGPQPLVLHFE